jgi:hypothetical protein
MDNLFQNTSSHWVRYSEYALRYHKGVQYVKPAPGASPIPYDPWKDATAMVVDALNTGMLQMKRAGADQVKTAIMDFVHKYGLLGFMTALPTTPHFMDYNAVYLPKNQFIKAESMDMEEYLLQFYPFEKPHLKWGPGNTVLEIEGDNEMAALYMALGNVPMPVAITLQRQYAERYDWLAAQFKDWAFALTSSFLYYEDYDRIDETTRNLYRLGMAAFGGITPTYHVALLDKPVIVWDFHSLLLGIQMMFSFLLTGKDNPLRCCRYCQTAFIAKRGDAVHCSAKCKNQGKAKG